MWLRFHNLFSSNYLKFHLLQKHFTGRVSDELSDMSRNKNLCVCVCVLNICFGFKALELCPAAEITKMNQWTFDSQTDRQTLYSLSRSTFWPSDLIHTKQNLSVCLFMRSGDSDLSEHLDLISGTAEDCIRRNVPTVQQLNRFNVLLHYECKFTRKNLSQILSFCSASSINEN